MRRIDRPSLVAAYNKTHQKIVGTTGDVEVIWRRLGRKGLRAAVTDRKGTGVMASWCPIIIDHAMQLDSAMTGFRRQMGVDTEVGMRRVNPYDWRSEWPYAMAAATEGKQVVGGAMIVPCWGFLLKRRCSHAASFAKPWLCVRQPVTDGVTLTDDIVADPREIRFGDCVMFDLSLRHSPAVFWNGQQYRAVQFGAVDWVIDAARSSVVFGGLPSA
jgi:hypothetical protein